MTMDKEKLWQDFADTASIHGIRFTSRNFSSYRRLAWAVLIITGLIVLTGMTIVTIMEYFDYKVNTIVTMVTENEPTFPAVTICNINTMRKSKLYDMATSGKYKDFIKLANALAMADVTGSGSNTTIPAVSGHEIRGIYQYTGHTMDDFEKGGMIVNCSFRHHPCNRSDFVPVLTQLGQCYTFNSGKQSRTVRTITQPGSIFGLQIRLSVQVDEYVLLPTQEVSTGLKVFIHHQNVLPLADVYGLAVSPGTHTLIGLKKQKIENLEPPYETACRKAPLETGDPYSRIGCLRVCEDKYIEKLCGCHLAINFLKEADSMLCNLEQSVKCALPAIDNFKKHGNDCYCPEPCESIEFVPTLSYAYFPSDVYANEVAKHLVQAKIASSSTAAAEYMRKNMVEVDVFYQQMDHMVIKQVPAKTVYNVYSDLGGLLGASLGASFLTFVELCDFIMTRLALRYKRKQEERTKIQAFTNELTIVQPDVKDIV